MNGVSSSLKRAYWRLSATARRALDLPGRLHAALYIALRLNRLYHRLGFAAETQLRLLPLQLWVSRRLMDQPYRVPVARIRWGGRPAGGEARVGAGLGRGLVFDGDWDVEDRRPLEHYLRDYVYSRAVFEMFEQGLPASATGQYALMSAAVARGDFSDWRTRGCRSPSDVDRHFEALARIHAAIVERGYASQAELGSARWHDEVKVFVGRDGALHKLQGAGHHRLAMALLAGTEAIPVLVIGVHRAWALEAQRLYRTDVVTALDLRIRDTLAQPLPSGPKGMQPELARHQAHEAPLGTVRTTDGNP